MKTRRMAVLSSVLAVAFLALAACGPGSQTTEACSVRDSAGVRIVEFSAPTAERRVVDQPLIVIGNVDGDPAHELFRVSTAFLSSDERVVVANAGTHEIRVFDSFGRHLRSIGGPGEGPGEFQSLDVVEELGDGRFAVLDVDLRRITIFGKEGEFLLTGRSSCPTDGCCSGGSDPIRLPLPKAELSGLETSSPTR